MEDLKDIHVNLVGIEVDSVKQDTAGNVIVEGHASLGLFEGSKKVGRLNAEIRSCVAGTSDDPVMHLIEQLTNNLILLTAGYATGMKKFVFPIAEGINDTNGGN